MRHPRFSVDWSGEEWQTRVALWVIGVLWAISLVAGFVMTASGADPVPVAWAWEIEKAKLATQAASTTSIPLVTQPKRYYLDAQGVYWELPEAPGVAKPPFPVPGSASLSTMPVTTAPSAGWPSTTRPALALYPVVTFTGALAGTSGGTSAVVGCTTYG